MSKYILSLITILITVSFLYAEDSFFEKQDEGWFFYKEKPEIVKKKKEKEPEKKASATGGGELFSEKMKKTGDALISRALENPTEENVKAFMEYNKAMLSLSDNFTRVWQKVLMKHPELLFETNLQYAYKDIDKAIENLSKEAGLYFIHSSTCPACSNQAKALKEFQKEHPSMVIFPITIDRPLPEFPNAAIDNGIISRLGIQTVPTILIYFPKEGKLEPISQGFIDKFELERGLYNYVLPVENEKVKEDIDRVLGYLSESSSDD